LPIRDILVHVDTSSSCRTRLWLAGQLARRFEADVLGIGSAAAGAAEERFMASLSHFELRGEWHTAEGLIAPSVTAMAAAADLVVIGQPDPDRLLVELNTPEDVIIACGRPVLVVPYVGDFGNAGDRVLVAWNGTREATRAVHDAVPLMSTSKAVTVLSVNSQPKDDTDRDGLVQHLVRHGLPATTELIEQSNLAVADIVKSRAAELSCDLVVMGAYGHSRLREMILGGMTRDMLNSMTLPVLMSH